VTDPLLAQPLAADIWIEQLRRNIEITAPKGAEKVDQGVRISQAASGGCSELSAAA
jgi:hypothetical protein